MTVRTCAFFLVGYLTGIVSTVTWLAVVLR